jgi:hypothetical protein
MHFLFSSGAGVTTTSGMQKTVWSRALGLSIGIDRSSGTLLETFLSPHQTAIFFFISKHYIADLRL